MTVSFQVLFLFSRMTIFSSLKARTAQTNSRFRNHIAISTVILLLTLYAATAVLLAASYRDTLRQEKTNLRNISTAFAAQTLTAMKGVDQLLVRVQHEYWQRSLRSEKDIKLDTILSAFPLDDAFLGLYIFGKDGQIVSQSIAPNVAVAPPSNKESMRYSGTVPREVLYVEVTNVDATTGHAIVNFSRPLFNMDNTQDGAVLVKTKTTFFQKIYNAVDLGNGGPYPGKARAGVGCTHA